MIDIVVPVFFVILVGYIFGRRNRFGADAEKLINDYVLFVALPALLFLAVARADPGDLAQWPFVASTLAGIFVAYMLGKAFAHYKKAASPQSSLVGMSSCYGTTGYMGIPIMIAAFGPQAAVPAAIATILHNIPAIMTVIVTHDLQKNTESGFMESIGKALWVTFKNPLTLAVIAGALFSVLNIPLPEMVVTFSDFLAAAAGPTALFALGLGLARIEISKQSVKAQAGWVWPVVLIKIAIQPLVTFVVLVLLMGLNIDIWFVAAVVMAAQPIGAGAYVFARRYGFFAEETSLAIIISLLITVVSMTFILQLMNSAM